MKKCWIEKHSLMGLPEIGHQTATVDKTLCFKLLLTKICVARESQTSYVCSSNPFLRPQAAHPKTLTWGGL